MIRRGSPGKGADQARARYGITADQRRPCRGTAYDL